jgi:hypothetical protein
VVEPTAAGLAGALPAARAQAPARSPAARERYLTTFHPDVTTGQLLDLYQDLRASL